MAGEINLAPQFHRQAYQVMDAPQQAYLLLELLPTAAAPGTGSLPVNFGLVLDRSGSMAGDKLRQMKAAAQSIVDRLGPDDLLSVTVFDDTADLIVPAEPVYDRELIKRRISMIDERGGTHMSTGMRKGLQELQKNLSPAWVSRMLLLTDGQTWEDQPACLELADQCRMSGIPVHALGLGVGSENNWDPRLLEDLAQRSGGEWTVVEAPEDVAAAFESTLRTMQGTAVSNASLTLRMVAGVSPRNVWRVVPLITRLGHHSVSTHDIQVYLGDVQHGIGQAVLAELLLPPRPVGLYRMLQADITYDVPGAGLVGERADVDVVLNYTDDLNLASQLNPRLMNMIERVTAHKLQTQALDEAAAGEVNKATQRLRAAATRLLELGETEMAQMASQQAQQIEQAGQVDQAAAQKMRYATRRLTENQ
jgi:Ca-activated chloride channel family protein